MKKKSKYLIALFVCLCIGIGIFIYFLFTPNIPISESLKTGLHGNYYHYVKLLNKSSNRNTVALKQFLELNNIYDGPAYEHGLVLIQLMKKNGDEIFSKVLVTIDSTQIQNLHGYVKAGMDRIDEKFADSLISEYPKTFRILHL